MLRLDRDRLFSAHRETFGPLTQPQVDGLNAIADGLETDPLLTDPRHGAYLLATAWHETAYTLQPIAERGPVSYFDRYDPVRADTDARRARARAMGNTEEGDGFKYRGRGYVQLTWKRNYALASRVLNADLVNNPDLALQPGLAFRILSSGCMEGWFTGMKLGDFINASKTDYIQARKVVNGLDRAAQIAQYARLYAEILTGALVREPAAEPAPPLLRRGMIGGDVLVMQRALIAAGYPVTRGADGAFGPATENAVRRLQRAHGLTPDGVVGPATHRALNTARAARTGVDDGSGDR